MVRNWEKRSHQILTWDEKQAYDMLLKLTIEKLKIKRAIEHHYTHITMATFFKKTDNTNCESVDW